MRWAARPGMRLAGSWFAPCASRKIPTIELTSSGRRAFVTGPGTGVGPRSLVSSPYHGVPADKRCGPMAFAGVTVDGVGRVRGAGGGYRSGGA